MATPFEDFIDFSAGMDRLKRFRPRVRTLVILAAWGVAAWYWHIALVLLACMALFSAGLGSDLAKALVIDGEQLRRESAERMESAESELREIRTQIDELRDDVSGLQGNLEASLDKRDVADEGNPNLQGG